MFEPVRLVVPSSDAGPFGCLVRTAVDFAVPVPKRAYRDFVELFAEAALTVTLPDGHTLFDDSSTVSMAAGDWFQLVFMGAAKWAKRAVAASIVSAAQWHYHELFTLVAGETDYLWGEGTEHSGTIVAANTDATQAFVQWQFVLNPTEYTVLADRIRLASAPTAQDVASGQPLSVRIRQA